MMKKNVAHAAAYKIIAVALLLVVGLIPFAGILHAQTQTVANPNQYMELTVDPLGSATMRGIVQSVGTNTMMVTSWGGTWTVNTTGSTQMMPSSMNNNLSGIQVGHVVGVIGAVPMNQNLTINAGLVHDWTAQGSLPVVAVVMTGQVTNIGANSLTVVGPDNVTYTVNLASGAQVWNSVRSSIPISSIQPNDIVRIDGTLNGNTVTATVVRDISR